MAAAPVLALQAIRLTLGNHLLLDGAELSVTPGDKLALVGRNGSGKSTLLKIAAGEIVPDDGVRFLQPGATIRYLPQEPDLTGFATTLAYVEDGLGEGDEHYRAEYLLQQLGLTGAESTANLSAARRAARRWPGRWRRSPISCYSTSRPTISTCRRSSGWKKRSSR